MCEGGPCGSELLAAARWGGKYRAYYVSLRRLAAKRKKSKEFVSCRCSNADSEALSGSHRISVATEVQVACDSVAAGDALASCCNVAAMPNHGAQCKRCQAWWVRDPADPMKLLRPCPRCVDRNGVFRVLAIKLNFEPANYVMQFLWLNNKLSTASKRHDPYGRSPWSHHHTCRCVDCKQIYTGTVCRRRKLTRWSFVVRRLRVLRRLRLRLEFKMFKFCDLNVFTFRSAAFFRDVLREVLAERLATQADIKRLQHEKNDPIRREDILAASKSKPETGEFGARLVRRLAFFGLHVSNYDVHRMCLSRVWHFDDSDYTWYSKLKSPRNAQKIRWVTPQEMNKLVDRPDLRVILETLMDCGGANLVKEIVRDISRKKACLLGALIDDIHFCPRHIVPG